MSSIKINLRNNIINKKKEFSQSKDTKHAIQAAVMKGMYKGIGGKKAIALPPYCTPIHITMEVMTKSKIRYSKLSTMYTEIIAEEFNKVFSNANIHNIRFRSNKNKLIMKATMSGISKEYIHEVSADNECLASVCLWVIKLSSLVQSDYYDFISSTLITYLYAVDRQLSRNLL